MTCSCAAIYVGLTRTGSSNWSPTCPEHGVGTDWHTAKLPEWEALRAETIKLQRQAREARRKAAESSP